MRVALDMVCIAVGGAQAFSLPHKGEGHLAKRNPFPRENRVVFDEESHTYTIDGVLAPRSTTGPSSPTVLTGLHYELHDLHPSDLRSLYTTENQGLLHAYASCFEPQRALAAMRSGRNWDEKRTAMESEGLGTTDEE